MGDDAFSISEYINEDWKEDGKVEEKVVAKIITYSGRWTSNEWKFYVFFSLKEICKQRRKHQSLNSFNQNRRNYSSFDRRYVEFLKAQYQIEYMSVQQEEKLIRRTKSKFSTLKRRYKQKCQHLEPEISQVFDFQELIYQQAKKICKKDHTNNLKHLVQQFQTLKQEQINLNESQHSDTSPQRLVTFKKTRSFTNKQKQNGTNQK